ncbi:hypothetical protein C8R46DRAFT_1295406 [Mycena filopes]|nr:hypothetical protein C8R46DRAFT_1295406 [Mycena filopes]
MQKMTEYDYTQEAMDNYLQTQSRIQNWTETTARSHPVDPKTPPTPAGTTIGLPRALAACAKHPTQRSRTPTARDIARQRHPSSPTRPRPPPIVYSYRQQTTTPYSSQLDITTQTADARGRYIQQQSYHHHQVTAPHTLMVPPVDYSPLARNPHPAKETFSHSLSRGMPNGHRAPPTATRRSKSAHSEQRVPLPPPQQYAPPVPPMPERHRTQSSARPAGAAAPFHPASYAPAPAPAHGVYLAPTSAVSSLQLPVATGYLPATIEHLQAQQQYQNPPMAKSKSKSSVTLQARYATESPRRAQPAQDVPPMPVYAPQAQQGFYENTRAAKSSATLYASPRGTPTKSKGKSSSSKAPKQSRHRPPMPEFGEHMSSPHPAASQMLYHSLVPVATYREEPVDDAHAHGYEKKPTLFARVFLGAKRRH